MNALVERRFEILGAKSIEGFVPPPFLPNDGFGDQEKKQPDIFAFDPANERFVIGLVKTGMHDLETQAALTEYDVFFDHAHPNGKRSLVYFMMPASQVADFTAMITHYIHRDYWNNMVIVSSKQ
ncbi:MAG: hypothetical protein KGJ59_07315 [Bacteroidota bacterium]|nr:hypothetical protein [Bacteroidota bacterium]